MAASKIQYAAITAKTAVIVNGVRFQKGDIYAHVRIAESLFPHFKKRLGFSAFDVVLTDQAAPKDLENQILLPLKQEIADLDEIKAKLEKTRAANKDLTNALAANEKDARNIAKTLAAIDPASLHFLDGDTQRLVIAAAREEMKKRTSADETQTAEENELAEAQRLMADAIADLRVIDGIGEQKAQRLTDGFAIDSRHKLHAVLLTADGLQKLAADEDLKASPKNLEHWLTQLDNAAAAEKAAADAVIPAEGEK